MISENATFGAHIETVAKKVRQKTGWVLRIFYTRRQEFMKTVFKTLILPHVDYCSQLWMPTNSQEIHTIEKLQKDFFNRIPAIRHLNYWEQLKNMRMLSLQRRLERYRILYTWKILTAGWRSSWRVAEWGENVPSPREPLQLGWQYKA